MGRRPKKRRCAGSRYSRRRIGSDGSGEGMDEDETLEEADGTEERGREE